MLDHKEKYFAPSNNNQVHKVRKMKAPRCNIRRDDDSGIVYTLDCSKYTPFCSKIIK